MSQFSVSGAPTFAVRLAETPVSCRTYGGIHARKSEQRHACCFLSLLLITPETNKSILANFCSQFLRLAFRQRRFLLTEA